MNIKRNVGYDWTHGEAVNSHIENHILWSYTQRNIVFTYRQALSQSWRMSSCSIYFEELVLLLAGAVIRFVYRVNMRVL